MKWHGLPARARAAFAANAWAGRPCHIGTTPAPTGPWARIRLDIAFFAAILIACGAAFYLSWDYWDDQAAQVYMAWGIFHGMRPYVDLVDPNWPGIILPHALAYLLSGTSAWGLRAVDLAALLALLSATSFILATWSVPRSLRLLVGAAYLTNYFGTSSFWTAQRESFCWPFFVISAIPFLLELRPRTASSADAAIVPTFGKWAWLFFGMSAGLSLWIKPSPWPAVVLVSALAVWLCDADKRRQTIRGAMFYFVGIGIVSLLFLTALAAIGALPGFVKWGIVYDLGPYSQVKWPWPTRLQMAYDYATTLIMRPVPLTVLLLGLVRLIFVRINAPQRRPLLAAGGIVFATAMTALLQGKTGSAYHFLPMMWAITLAAGAVWAVQRPAVWITRMAYAIAAVLAVGMVVDSPPYSGPVVGSLAGEKLKSILAPDDQIVAWGYATTVYARAERRTPFMTIIGTSILITSPPDSWPVREVLDRLNTALRNPAVKCLLVEQRSLYHILPGPLEYPRDYLKADPALRATISNEYRPMPPGTIDGFDVLIHMQVHAHQD